ncbi:MAG: DUF7715 family protein [Jatrophihabitans sp.]|uniref:DUF7715 family protein n=1 Tax=Jatrophihabitans sp. TaxID=1932789 RepID=UPI003F815239
MRILTATSQGQGGRSNDFTWTYEGELVWPGVVCGRDRADPDGGCGCGRSFSGLNSHRATTTALVRDLPLTAADVRAALAGYLESAGYPAMTPRTLAETVETLLAAVAEWPVGAVIERRGDHLQQRRPIPAPSDG